MIGVIDYGMGNLYSVSKALERVGVPYFVSEKPEELKEADASFCRESVHLETRWTICATRSLIN